MIISYYYSDKSEELENIQQLKQPPLFQQQKTSSYKHEFSFNDLSYD